MSTAKSQARTRPHVDRELTSRLKVVLEKHPEVQAAFLFGSHARGTAWAGSDVDVAIVFDPSDSAWIELDLQEMLTSRLGMPVQVINLAAAGPNIVEAVRRDGVTLVDRAKSTVERPNKLAESHQSDDVVEQACWNG